MPRKLTSRGGAGPAHFVPRTAGQQRLWSALRNTETRLLVVRGPAGTGKSMFAMQEALRELEEGNTRKVVMIRPAISCNENLGYLPGDLTEKLGPWMLPFHDAIGDLYPPQKWAQWRSADRLETCSIGMIRGRTFRYSWVIADEMQNASPHQMRTLLTRIGEGCRMVILGDPTQTDLAKKDGNGLEDLWNRLASSNGPTHPNTVDTVELEAADIQRDPLVAFAEELYQIRLD